MPPVLILKTLVTGQTSLSHNETNSIGPGLTLILVTTATKGMSTAYEGRATFH